jgi:hypothetical protein
MNYVLSEEEFKKLSDKGDYVLKSKIREPIEEFTAAVNKIAREPMSWGPESGIIEVSAHEYQQAYATLKAKLDL